MNGAMPRDSVEAQRLRIDIKYYEILWSPNPVNDRRHNDLIDMIIYYTAKAYNLKLLTLDKKLKEMDNENIVINNLDM